MNYLEITGIVASDPVQRELADGTSTLSWRVKVEREESGNDSIPCTINTSTAPKSLVTKVQKIALGQNLEISGKLRSRFWQGPKGNGSRIEVEVDSVKRISKT